MADSARDTIAAIATPPGPGRRGILRVSGARAAELVRSTLREARPEFDAARTRALVHGRFDDGRGLQPLTLFWMRAPRSFTREDVAEFHLPGAEPLLAAGLARLVALGARPARPGEFTRRAFLNGRLDLSRAEGVLAATEAGNEAERVAAALLLDGALATHVGGLRERLLALATLCEASLDFDEGETGHVAQEELRGLLGAAREALGEARAFEQRRAAPSALPRLVLLGAPNAGKSSLWNVLTGGRALVSASAGTTRDALEGTWSSELGSWILVDGPGFEARVEGPAAKAQALFEDRRAEAELGLWVVDATAPELVEPPEGAQLFVWNKVDHAEARPLPEPSTLPRRLPAVAVSARERRGLGELASAVARLLAGPGWASEGGAARALHARHHEALARVGSALAEADTLLASAAPLDLVAEALRSSLGALDELSGRTTPEDVLERIFQRFCLGK